jgi:hypothetical protein
MAVPPDVVRTKSIDDFRSETLFHLLRCSELRLISIWHPSFLTLLLDSLPQFWESLLSKIASGYRAFSAVRSHFYEFLDEKGRPHLAHELKQDQEYEVVITTSGGLWRYRLMDRVRVTGFVSKTPALRFLGKTSDFADQRGEKLSEAFVANALQEALKNHPPPRFALLAPNGDQSNPGYTLFVEGELSPDIVARFDTLLQENPHYAWCLKLGQLRPVQLFRIRTGGFRTFAQRECSNGMRLGDVKPRLLSAYDDWSKYFEGDFEESMNCTAQ